MALQIYNTLSRQKEEFKPLKPGKISMYVCGITVYDYCHIGHARVLVAFDVITKFLRSQGWDVTYVRNITDIDDKIIKRANENGEQYTDLTKRFIDYMHEDEARLGIARPDIEPRATAFIDQIINMNQALIDKGYAYPASNGDVYYRVTRFADYGKLTNKNVDELLVGARIEVDEIKEDPRDFVLWKAAKAGEPAWKSPWGQGRPGWHIECSAMSKDCCGTTFDIHGGGPDLPFPHHENEIAQSEAANGCKYVNYWMHAGAVRVDGEKMSKSLGNFFTIRDVLEKYHPEVVRFLLVSSHYRSPINYAEDNLVEARTGLERFYGALRDYADVESLPLTELQASDYYRSFVAAMNDDFNTRVALASMYDLVRELNNAGKTDVERAQRLAGELKALGLILGILQENPRVFLQTGTSGQIAAEEVDRLVAERIQAKKEKNYARADEVRKQLADNGILIEDAKDGTTQWRRE
ncbi:cysteine--tRNA ligase [Cellvibrio japonicus]|uniref:Cysteine--tRNA ligase n=1 Tax=Cellvibrio japonicus (strain Ueda107) TaxID=498211 RepID=B3PEV7_CELJU|nr:cysteine--tRNA ligase [Cellvibrio japonicus]ACE84981.1 cysteinyl-tRNA synthetase [Cellvibrio japonicus Ueda107]QEI12203.1 cysteine--tRNA ligase [Cellvibrio japonicus]QEI15777.1 cysteine--tRNA ligase [Cellvibrio japonicus]QEI19355.1 cysteine--tRNA ligase [Cellvibrio japonicus]